MSLEKFDNGCELDASFTKNTLLYRDNLDKFTSISAHNATDVKIGRWHKLSGGTQARNIEVQTESGERIEFTIFRNV